MNTCLSPLRVALFLLCALAVRAIVAQGPAEVGAPLIRLQTPVITKGWQSGISRSVCLAAMMPAIRAMKS